VSKVFSVRRDGPAMLTCSRLERESIHNSRRLGRAIVRARRDEREERRQIARLAHWIVMSGEEVEGEEGSVRLRDCRRGQEEMRR
jgi:hypothetical protein